MAWWTKMVGMEFECSLYKRFLPQRFWREFKVYKEEVVQIHVSSSLLMVNYFIKTLADERFQMQREYLVLSREQFPLYREHWIFSASQSVVECHYYQQWAEETWVHTKKACVTGVQVRTAARQPSSSRVSYNSTVVPYSLPLTIPYSSNEGTWAVMKKREIEDACMPKACMSHPQFSSNLDSFYI